MVPGGSEPPIHGFTGRVASSARGAPLRRRLAKELQRGERLGRTERAPAKTLEKCSVHHSEGEARRRAFWDQRKCPHQRCSVHMSLLLNRIQERWPKCARTNNLA